MRTVWLGVTLTCSFAMSMSGLAQVTKPHVPVSPEQQLQQTPVTDLHMGTPAKMKNPYAGDSQAWMQGKKLYKAMNCIVCHSPGGGGGYGPALSDNVWIYGGSPGQIYLSILHGRPNGMPQWGTSLPPQAIWELVTYVKSLSQPNPKIEPQTPLGTHPMPGKPPHPAARRMPPRVPRHQKPTPKPAYPAPASTPSVKTPAAPRSSLGKH